MRRVRGCPATKKTSGYFGEVLCRRPAAALCREAVVVALECRCDIGCQRVRAVVFAQLLLRELDRRRILQHRAHLLREQLPALSGLQPGVTDTKAAAQDLPVVVEMLLHLERDQCDRAVRLDSEGVDFRRAHQPRRQRRKLLEQLLLGLHSAGLIDPQHAVVQIATPHFGIAGRHRVEHFLYDFSQLRFRRRRRGRVRDAERGQNQRHEHEQARTDHARTLLKVCGDDSGRRSLRRQGPKTASRRQLRRVSCPHGRDSRPGP